MELKFPVGLEKNEVLIERDGIKIRSTVAGSDSDFKGKKQESKV